MDQKNIGQVSGVNDRERQDFSGLNSSSVEQVPEEVGQMPSGGFGAERVPTGMTQDEAVARLNQMFEAQGMPGANGFDRGQMAMGQMAMQAQMNGVPDQVQMNSVPWQGQFEQVNPMQIHELNKKKIWRQSEVRLNKGMSSVMRGCQKVI